MKRTLKERAYLYRPAITRDKVIGHALRERIDRMFGDSAEGLVMSLIEEQHLTPEKLTQLHALIDEAETARKQQ